MTEPTTRRILKWSVPVNDRPHPIGAGPVVHIACQYGPESVQVWTDETKGGGTRFVQVYGTGSVIPESGRILGSAVTAGGALVWHVVEVRVDD